jgi:hypothetical protein
MKTQTKRIALVTALLDGSLDFINQRFESARGFLRTSCWHRVGNPPSIGTMSSSSKPSGGSSGRPKRLARWKWRLRQSDGAYRWFQIAAKPIHDERAILIRWCGTNTDIHDLKCSEQKLRTMGTEIDLSDYALIRVRRVKPACCKE